MGGRKKVHKNRIFLSLFIMTLLMIIVALVSAVFLANTAVNSIVRDCKTFDATVEKVAVMTEQEIEQKKKMLNCYAQILENTKSWGNQDFLRKFLEFEDQGEFEGFALIRQEGNIVTDEEQIIGREEAELARMALTDENFNMINDIYVGVAQEDKVFYAIPLYFNNYSKGILAGIASSGMDVTNYGEGIKSDDSEFYLLNTRNEVVISAGGKGRDFRYGDIYENHFFDASRNPIEQMEEIVSDIKNIQVFGEEGNNLWYKKPVTINGEEWKLVMGKVMAISGDSLSLIASSAFLVAFVIAFSFTLMVILVVSQGRSNHKLGKLAYFDFITGYQNWNRFELEAEKYLHRKRGTLRYVMVGFDIRKFRIITDIDGERKGEIILKNVAEILKKNMRKGEYFARFSIDEFGMLLLCESEEEAMKRVESIDRMLKQLVPVQGISFCYGMYFISDNKMPVQKIYNYTGLARDNVKENHTKFIGIFNDSMRENMVREKELESLMQKALDNSEFKVYLQPKYMADGSCVGGAEALVRWVSPELGFISPGDFIPLFEKNGFIMKLDDYMIDHVCSIQKKWMKEGKKLVTISVNMSRVHLVEQELVTKITGKADSYGIPHDCIELELTESAFFDDKEVLLNTVVKLRKEGFLVSMDDFGSGYSSLNSLKDLPLDVVKLDGEFFKKTENWARSETVVKDTISLAKHLKMKIVAEGIETKEQVEFLNEIGCDLIQGYYFAKPMPVNDFEKLMGY